MPAGVLVSTPSLGRPIVPSLLGSDWIDRLPTLPGRMQLKSRRKGKVHAAEGPFSGPVLIRRRGMAWACV